MKKVGVCVLFWFLLFPVFVLAQQNAVPLPEVVVTASRIKETQTASSVTVITAKELKAQGVTNVVDALREVPGVIVTQNGFGGTASVYVRGGDNGQAVIMIDGVPVYDPSGPNKGDFSAFLPHLSVADIDRIEIVRGPQSVLYGSSAMTGVINIITKKGKGKPQTTARLEGGSFNTFTETLGLSGANENVSYNLNLGRFDSSGISKTPDEPDKDGYRFNNAGGSLTAHINEKVEIGTSFSYLDAEQGLDGWDDFEKDRLEFVQTYYKQKILPRWQHTLKLAYTGTHRTYPSSASFYDGDLYFLSWQHNVNILPDLKFIGGFDYQQERANTKWMDEKTQDERAWFGEMVFDWQNVYFNAGVRYDRHQTAGDKVTYRLAGSYLLPTETRLHASFGTGFRAPSLYQLYGSYGNPDLKPEKSQGYDVGISQSFLNERVKADVTYFFNWLRDEIDWINNQYVNTSKSHIQGVELNVAATPLACLKIQLFYTWLNAKDVTRHTWLLKRPHHRGGFELTYFLPHKRGTVDFRGIYTDRYYDYGQVLVPSYFVAYVSARCRLSSHLSVLTRVNNLFNAHYQETYGYNTMPFNLYGGIEFKW